MADTTREAELMARLVEVEARLAEVEARPREPGMQAGTHLGDAIDALLAAVLPAEALVHMRAARKEQLLAVRAVLDRWIELAGHEPAKHAPAGRRRRETIPLAESQAPD